MGFHIFSVSYSPNRVSYWNVFHLTFRHIMHQPPPPVSLVRLLHLPRRIIQAKFGLSITHSMAGRSILGKPGLNCLPYLRGWILQYIARFDLVQRLPSGIIPSSASVFPCSEGAILCMACMHGEYASSLGKVWHPRRGHVQRGRVWRVPPPMPRRLIQRRLISGVQPFSLHARTTRSWVPRNARSARPGLPLGSKAPTSATCIPQRSMTARA